MSRAVHPIYGYPLALLVLVAGLALSSPIASAHKQKIRDPKGDATFRQGDIRNVTVRHTNGGRIKVTFRLTRKVRRNGYIFPGLSVKASGRRYNVSLAVFDVTRRSKAKQTGETRIKYRGRRLIQIFHADAIGSPSSFRWRARTDSVDPPPIDWAPNKRFRRHRLAKPRA